MVREILVAAKDGNVCVRPKQAIVAQVPNLADSCSSEIAVVAIASILSFFRLLTRPKATSTGRPPTDGPAPIVGASSLLVWA